MILSQIDIRNFRNLSNISGLQLDPTINLIYGENGAGKTSLLESIYYLAMGRSFRNRLAKHVISHNTDKLTIFSRIKENGQQSNTVPVGIETSRKGEKQIHINGDKIKSKAELVKLIPIQVINAQSYKLLEMGPYYRRQFLDWGLFHVEQQFLDCWQTANRILKQRNAAIRQHAANQLALWDQELGATSQTLHSFRERYIKKLDPIFNDIMGQLTHELDVSLHYKAGWDTTKTLVEVLQQNIAKDLRLGYTSSGPQRADIQCMIGDTPAYEILSRGQQKLLIYALILAQGICMQQQKNNSCIYLIDDLPSELDTNHRMKISKILSQLNAQIFITGIHKDSLANLPLGKGAVFHVEHGEIRSAPS